MVTVPALRDAFAAAIRLSVFPLATFENQEDEETRAFSVTFKIVSQTPCMSRRSCLISRLSQRRRRSASSEATGREGAERPGGWRFLSGRVATAASGKCEKTVDDDEKLRHNLTSLLLMQRRE
ncbi:hypothetical protein, partial [Pandoraea sp. CB10b_02]|uniref:hypothetical protein n=1 Tax=Pandoraea sp. CB10b_02 TaxID=2014535 RepID=UPI00257CBD12